MLSSSGVQDTRPGVSAGALLDRYAAYILIAPTLAGVLIVDVYPLIFNTLISFQARKISTAQPHFVGLQNYAAVILDPEMLHSLKVSIIFTAVSVCFSYLIGLLLALLLNRPIKGRGFLRSL